LPVPPELPGHVLYDVFADGPPMETTGYAPRWQSSPDLHRAHA